MAVTRCKRHAQKALKKPVECQQLGCDAPEGATIRYRVPGPGWGYPDRVNEQFSDYSPPVRVELQEHGGRWVCAWCRKLAETRASLGRPLSTIGASLIALALTACQSGHAFLDTFNLYPDAPTCSYAPRDCQSHWLTCAGMCERTTDGTKLPIDGRAQRITERCSSYFEGVRRLCADVRGESFERAICADYAEGWCEWSVECMPKPAECN